MLGFGLALAVALSAPAERIAGEELSWGRVQRAWSIDMHGDARFSEREGSDFHNYYLVTRRADVGREGYNVIARLVTPLRDMVGIDPKCAPGATDGPYGQVTWIEGSAPVRFGFNSNCVSKQTDAGFFWNEQAREQVRRWTERGEVVERKWMGAPGQEPK